MQYGNIDNEQVLDIAIEKLGVDESGYRELVAAAVLGEIDTIDLWTMRTDGQAHVAEQVLLGIALGHLEPIQQPDQNTTHLRLTHWGRAWIAIQLAGEQLPLHQWSDLTHLPDLCKDCGGLDCGAYTHDECEPDFPVCECEDCVADHKRGRNG